MNINFTSLGCDKNLVDSEIMLGIIERGGHVLTDDAENSDIIIINTCGFILDATQEGIETILELASYKREGKCKALIVTGCMATRYKEQIFEEMPEVDAVVGVNDYPAINSVIDKVLTSDEKVSWVNSADENVDENLYLNRVLTSQNHYAYLKIAEGCDNHCTYCTIPKIRGAFRSRTIENIVKEAKMLVEKGVKEIIIVAQDTALYGKDIYGKQSLHLLLKELEKINDIYWIRLLYCYPEHIYDDLIDEIKNNEKVINYIDMPIQHSNNKILKLMGRRSSEEQLYTIINKLRTAMPDIILRTTLIVGFPNETEEEFNSLYNFVETVKFDKLGVFKYSREEDTPAFNMDNQVDEDEKTKRLEAIMDLQKNISSRESAKYVGKVFDVIIDGKLEEEDVYVGRTYMDCIEVDGLVFFKCEFEIITGSFIKIKITNSSDYDLIGEIFDEFAE